MPPRLVKLPCFKRAPTPCNRGYGWNACFVWLSECSCRQAQARLLAWSAFAASATESNTLQVSLVTPRSALVCHKSPQRQGFSLKRAAAHGATQLAHKTQMSRKALPGHFAVIVAIGWMPSPLSLPIHRRKSSLDKGMRVLADGQADDKARHFH